MGKRLLTVLLLLLLLPGMALANRQYIIPDSNARDLTEAELWGWDYESLGFILNEIFARHGYNFIPGGRYDVYFAQRPWYTPNANADNSAACYPQLSSLEWRNERLVKNVRAQMKAQGTANSGGMNYLDYVKPEYMDVLSGFTLATMKSGQKLDVYSAPSGSAYRGANGKAMVNTNGSVYVAGWENGWLLVMYETNKGAVRVGYVEGGDIRGNVQAGMLRFAYEPMTLQSSAALTDDPATSFTAIRTLAAGEQVMYLDSFYNRNTWAYVETTVEGKAVRGFIPYDTVDGGLTAEDSENASE